MKLEEIIYKNKFLIHMNLLYVCSFVKDNHIDIVYVKHSFIIYLPKQTQLITKNNIKNKHKHNRRTN